MKKSRGITLIALVITIIVLLILAGVSIATLTGENSIFEKVNESKIQQAIGSIKEAINLERAEKRIEGTELTPESLIVKGKIVRRVQRAEDDRYYIYYVVKENEYQGMQGLGKGSIDNFKDVFLIDDSFNIKYINQNGEEFGGEVEKKELTDETKISFFSKEFSKYISKIAGVSEEDLKFLWMKNQTNLLIEDSKITSLEDLVFFPNLISLNVKNLELQNLNGIENCHKIKSISFTNSSIKEYKKLSYLNNLSNLILDNQKDFKFLNLIYAIKTNRDLRKLELVRTKINQINGIEELIYLRDLSISASGVENIEAVSKLTNLERLTLENNIINNIEALKTLIQLKYLNLSGNKIKDITILSELSNLMTLKITKNPKIKGNRKEYNSEEINKLDKIGEIIQKGGDIYVDVNQLSLFKNYKKIDLFGNNLTDLSVLKNVEGLENVEQLSLGYNRLTLEDSESQEIIKKMTNLKILNLTGNNVNNLIAIANLKNLESLYLEGENNNCNLKQIEDIISKIYLKVNQNTLNTITNCDITKITEIKLRDNYFSILPDISKFSNLKILNIGGCSSLTNIEIISNIESLEVLVMDNCNLHERMISFEKLKYLKNIKLEKNFLWTEDLIKLQKIKNNQLLEIHLENNAIIEAGILLEFSPQTKIFLGNNVNLSKEAKEVLLAKFKNNLFL